jgi:hypothetical protein
MESSSRIPRRVLFALGSIATIFVAESSCAPTLPLDGRPCPCTADYHCCESINECRPNGDACPAEPGTGGGRSNDAGHEVATGSGGLGGAGGSSTAGGVPVDAGPPRWRSMDAPGLAAYEVHDACDLELDSNGTPYVAFRACKGCNSTSAVSPVVLKYDAGKWVALPALGLIPTTIHAPLVVSTDGAPHLLVENAVLSFDGTRWTERVPRVPGSITQARNFELDAGDRFVVTVYDASKSELSVLGYEGTTWRVLGNVMPSEPNRDRLTRGGNTLWLAHTTGTATPLLLLRRFDGTAWSIVLDLDALASAEFAVTSAETMYVARQEKSPGPVLVIEGRGSLWTEILNVSMFGTPSLRIGPNGILYSATLMDGFVNLSDWDGSKWTDWDREGLGTGSHVPALRVAERAGRIVPYLCYASGTDLNVMTYE